MLLANAAWMEAAISAIATDLSTPATTRPPNPSELAQQKADFDERLRLYLEVEAVEPLLKNQLIAAFDDDYIHSSVKGCKGCYQYGHSSHDGISY